MNCPAAITFSPGEPPQEFTLHHRGAGKPWSWPNPHCPDFTGQTWRYLADDCALELVPLCDGEARPVAAPPVCDRLTIWPVCWGYPDSLVTNHPNEVEAMRRDHFAGKHELIDGNHTFEFWLECFGKLRLWLVSDADGKPKFRTAEMEQRWLSSYTPPGSTLFLWAGTAGCVSHAVRERIQFRADFHRGDHVETIWLADCAREFLTVEERKLSPGYRAQEDARLRKQAELTAASKGAAKTIEQRLDQLQKFWPDNPAVLRARQTILRRGVPEAFMEWATQYQDLQGQWPSGEQAFAACREHRWQGKRGGLSPQSVHRWLYCVRTERRKAGLDIGAGEDAMRHKLRQSNVDRISDDTPTPDEIAAANDDPDEPDLAGDDDQPD